MKTKLEILEPCNQDWSKMSSLEKDKFCSECQKTVIDFTAYNSKTILEVLMREKKVCGRLKQKQLKKNYLSGKTKKLVFPKLAFMVGIGAVLGFSEPIQAKAIQPETELTAVDKWNSILPKKESDSITLNGVVYDSAGFVLPGVNIILKDSHVGVQTDFDGKFSITISSKKLSDENYLQFSYIGYENKDYRFYKENKQLSITMEHSTALMGEVIIVRKMNIFERIGYFFSNLFSKN